MQYSNGLPRRSANSATVSFCPSEQKCLAPGYSVDCRVTFLPDEPRYYEDCIRVHTEDHESQLIVPLYAYPVIGNFEFPELIEFPPTTIGQKNLLINFGRRTHVIPIKSSSVVDFEFRIQIMKIHPSFSIQPLKGVLHSGQITKLHINFQPTSYTTCELKFELHVAQVNFLAKCCTIIGNAIPGLEKDEDNLMEPVDPKYKTGEEINSIKHHEKLKKLKYSFRKLQSLTSRNFGEEREKLPEMTCPHHLVKFLLHHHEKVISSQGSNLISDELNRQQMLLAFEAMVHQNFIDEQRNQVRWQSKLGATSLSFEEHMKILETRQLAWNRYNAACTHPEVLENSTDPLSLSPSMNLISNRINQLLYEFRPYRPVDPFVKLKKLKTTLSIFNEPKFHLVEFSKAKWLYKCDIIEKFRSIVSSIIIKQRMIKRLKKLKQFTLSTDEDKDSASNQSTEEKYAYNSGRSIPSLSLNNCGSKLLHQYVWFQRNLLTDEKMMLSNLTGTLPTNNRISSNIQTSCIQPIPCTFNYNQLMSSFTTPQQYWPIFDVPVSALHYELKYTDKFELNTAMDYAKLIPMEINYRELLPLKQQQHHHRQQERPQDQMLTNPMMPISSKLFDDNKTPESRISTSTKNPVNSAISLPKSLHSLPKSNVYTDNYLYNHYLNLTSVNHSTLKDYSNSLISSLNKTISSLHQINPSSLSNSTYLDTILLSLNQAESHQTLTKWSSSSKSHKPLIPIPLFSCSEIQETSTDQVTSKENTTFKNYQLNENGSEYIEEMVEQDVKEWLTRFPELNSLLMNKNEDRKAKHNEETYTELNNPLLHLNNAPIEESKKYADEILSACKFKF
ncbi:unnamed protein product [Heterobilharzia americana]|nr:unnamed protein product [Heterobilharzia americana]